MVKGLEDHKIVQEAVIEKAWRLLQNMQNDHNKAICTVRVLMFSLGPSSKTRCLRIHSHILII
jgi:hypothetical protein